MIIYQRINKINDEKAQNFFEESSSVGVIEEKLSKELFSNFWNRTDVSIVFTLMILQNKVLWGVEIIRTL